MLIPIDIERTLRAIREAFRDLASPQDPDFEARLEAAAAEGGLVDARGAAPEEYIEPLPSVLRLRPPLPAMTPDEVIAYDLLARHWFSRARLAEESRKGENAYGDRREGPDAGRRYPERPAFPARPEYRRV